MTLRRLSGSTVDLIKECILTAEDRDAFPLRGYLHECCLSSFGLELSDGRTARFQVDGLIKAIDWTKIDEIRPIFPIVGNLYAESPIHPLSFHRSLDKALASDGFRIIYAEVLPLLT